jgi:triphosphatase
VSSSIPRPASGVTWRRPEPLTGQPAPAGGGRGASDDEEIELKFEVADPAALAALFERSASVAAGFESDPEVATRSVLDIYFDTHDGRLRAAGLVARLRSEMGRHRVTLKSTARPVNGAVYRRLEVEGAALPTLVPETWPLSDARILIQAAIAGQPLEVIARLRQRRRTIVIRRREAAIELSLDDLEALPLAGADGASRDRALATRTELEAELLSGEVDDLRDLETALAVLPALRPATQSKVEWARGAADAGLATGRRD